MKSVKSMKSVRKQMRNNIIFSVYKKNQLQLQYFSNPFSNPSP